MNILPSKMLWLALLLAIALTSAYEAWSACGTDVGCLIEALDF